MSMRSFIWNGAALAAAALALTACQTANQQKLILSTKPPLELRAMQTRAFDTTDQNKTMRTVIATLQDLGYKIDKVEPAAGSISATKLSALQMSVSIYPRGTRQLAVRSNAQVKIMAQQNNIENQVDDPEFYQKLFFEPLSKALFLNALLVEDGDTAEVNGGKPTVAANDPQNTPQGAPNAVP